jgi:hypothetical protein
MGISEVQVQRPLMCVNQFVTLYVERQVLAGFVPEIEGATFSGQFAKWQGKIRCKRQRLLDNNRVAV